MDEARAEAILLVEWPERLGPLRPADALTVELRMLSGAARSATLAGNGGWPARLAAEGLA